MRLSKEASRFLKWVWSHHDEGYVFLSVKYEDRWTDIPVAVEDLKMVGDRLEIPGVPMTGADLYFCPNAFSEPRRKKEFALPVWSLHADLDEVTPEEADNVLKCSAAWETSRGRYQCLWEMDEPLTPELHAKVNSRFTYLTGADKGGWSVTKALRVPGTVSYKRDEPQKVVLIFSEQQVYIPRVVVRVAKKWGKIASQVREGALEPSDESFRDLIEEHRSKLNSGALSLLRAPRATGDRSARLWSLECYLVEAGIPHSEVLTMVRETVWNKYKGQARELKQLSFEILKAAAQVQDKSVGSVGVGGGNKKSKINGFDQGKIELMSYSTFMKKEIPAKQWAVEGIWSDAAHGFMAGEPKTFKSFIATDLAVSVASGTPFLGRFKVPEKGHAIIIQEENTLAMMRDRLEKITISRGLGGEVIGTKVRMPERLDVSLVNCRGMDLTSDEHLEMLDGWMTEKKPKLVVLDPLYLMISGLNESSQEAMVPVLKSLLELKRKHTCGMLIVHHYNKPRDGDDRSSMMRLSGSGVLGRWFESIIYLDKLKAPGAVRMTTEHRSNAPTKPIRLQFDLGPMGTPDYFVDVEEDREADGAGSSREQIVRLLEGAGRGGMTAAELGEQLGLDHRHVSSLAGRMKLKSKTVAVPGVAGRPPKRFFV